MTRRHVLFSLFPLFPLFLALATWLPVAAATKQIDLAEPAEPDGVVEIELLAGEVEIVGWAGGEVTVTGTINDEVEDVELERHGRTVTVEVEILRGEHRNIRTAADLRIQVPFDSRVEVETISADVSTEGLSGTIRSESVSGKMQLRGRLREAEASTISGTIDIRSEESLLRGSFESVSGDIRLRGPLSPLGRFTFESLNGTITLRLPADTSAEFSVDTFNGNIENELGPAARRTSEFLQSKHLGFSLGQGEARVSAEAFNGTVRILKD